MNIIKILIVFWHVASFLWAIEFFYYNNKPKFGIAKPNIYYYEQAFNINFKDRHRDVENDMVTANILSRLEYIDESNELTKSLVSKPALYLYAQNFYKTFYEIKSNQALAELMESTEWKRYNLQGKNHQVLYLMSYNTTNSFFNEPISKYTEILNRADLENDFIEDHKRFKKPDSNDKKEEKVQITKSKKIFILYNKPVFVYTIGLCKSKINAIEVLLPKLFFHFQNQLTYRCLKDKISLNAILSNVVNKFEEFYKKMHRLGSLNFDIIFEDNLLASHQEIPIYEFQKIYITISMIKKAKSVGYYKFDLEIGQ